MNAAADDYAALKARVEALEEICKRDRFADGYAAGCKDFQMVGGKRIDALKTALREILDCLDYANNRGVEWKIARAALDKDAQ